MELRRRDATGLRSTRRWRCSTAHARPAHGRHAGSATTCAWADKERRSGPEAALRDRRADTNALRDAAKAVAAAGWNREAEGIYLKGLDQEVRERRMIVQLLVGGELHVAQGLVGERKRLECGSSPPTGDGPGAQLCRVSERAWAAENSAGRCREHMRRKGKPLAGGGDHLGDTMLYAHGLQPDVLGLALDLGAISGAAYEKAAPGCC